MPPVRQFRAYEPYTYLGPPDQSDAHLYPDENEFFYHTLRCLASGKENAIEFFELYSALGEHFPDMLFDDMDRWLEIGKGGYSNWLGHEFIPPKASPEETTRKEAGLPPYTDFNGDKDAEDRYYYKGQNFYWFEPGTDRDSKDGDILRLAAENHFYEAYLSEDDFRNQAFSEANSGDYNCQHKFMDEIEEYAEAKVNEMRQVRVVGDNKKIDVECTITWRLNELYDIHFPRPIDPNNTAIAYDPRDTYTITELN